MRILSVLAPLTAALALGAASSAMANPAPVPAPATAAGKTAFAVCAACHGTRAADKRMGPTMAGALGRQAGTLPGYAYSPAMAKAGFTWDERRLDDYIANPKSVVPGTKMVFRGVDDAGKRKAIIAYIASLPSQ